MFYRHPICSIYNISTVGFTKDLSETHVIIVSILGSCDGKHTNERDGGGDGGQGADDGNQLQHQEAEEVEVGQPLELLKQVVGQEVEQRVFGRLNVVFLGEGGRKI